MWPYGASHFYFGQAPSRPSFEKPSGHADGSGSYSYYPGVYHTSGTNVADGEDVAFWPKQYNPSQYGVVSPGPLGSSNPHQFVEESWSSAITDEEDEPFFSDMSGQNPVFSLDTHSNYHHARKVVTQAHFTPKAFLQLNVPASRHANRNNPEAPFKRGF